MRPPPRDIRRFLSRILSRGVRGTRPRRTRFTVFAHASPSLPFPRCGVFISPFVKKNRARDGGKKLSFTFKTLTELSFQIQVFKKLKSETTRNPLSLLQLTNLRYIPLIDLGEGGDRSAGGGIGPLFFFVCVCSAPPRRARSKTIIYSAPSLRSTSAGNADVSRPRLRFSRTSTPSKTSARGSPNAPVLCPRRKISCRSIWRADND